MTEQELIQRLIALYEYNDNEFMQQYANAYESTFMQQTIHHDANKVGICLVVKAYARLFDCATLELTFKQCKEFLKANRTTPKNDAFFFHTKQERLDVLRKYYATLSILE